MDANDRGRAQGIADAILEHLRRHPLAADSAEGVARWWLAPPLHGASLDEVEQVLEALVARGVLRRVQLGDGRALYSQCLPTRQ
jgi:hypothetical protein